MEPFPPASFIAEIKDHFNITNMSESHEIPELFYQRFFVLVAGQNADVTERFRQHYDGDPRAVGYNNTIVVVDEPELFLDFH